MNLTTTEPLLFEPIFQERVWGGRSLERAFGKKLPAGKSIGESWEIVDRPEAQSVVRQGPLRGRTLHDLWREQRREIFGVDFAEVPRFPILAKLLDAQDRLSLQVHPPVGVAAELGGESKTELWYVAAAAPGAEIFLGLRRGVARADFERALRAGTVADCAQRVPVQRGEVVFLPSGRLHALGAGVVIVEIQQNSDTTYRVFDWNRAGDDGQPRALQIDEALRAIDFTDFEPEKIKPAGEILVRAPEFTVEKWRLIKPRRAIDRASAALFVCLEGTVALGNTEMGVGDFFLVTAGAGESELQPRAARTELLRVTAPIR